MMSLITYHNMRKIASVIFFSLLRNVEKSNFLLYSFSKSSCILRWPQKKRTRWNIFLKLRRSTRVGVVKKKSFAIIIIIVFSLKNKSTSVNKMNIFYLYKDIVHIFPKLTIFFLDFTRV